MSCSCPAVRWQPCPDGTWIEMTSTSPTAGKLCEAADAGHPCHQPSLIGDSCGEESPGS
jgi:hypothetical protein